MTGEFDEGGAAGGHHEHLVLDQCCRFAGDELFLWVGVDRGGRIMIVVKRERKGAAMDFDEFVVIGKFLEVAADGVFRDVQFLTKTGGQDLVMQVYLM